MTRLGYGLKGLDVGSTGDFMVIEGRQIILRPWDLPEGCELRSGTETYICCGKKKVLKSGVLAYFALDYLRRVNEIPMCCRGTEVVELVNMVGRCGDSVYEDSYGRVWVADERAELMARHWHNLR